MARPPSNVPTDLSSESSDEEDRFEHRSDARGSSFSVAGPMSPLRFWYIDHAGGSVLKKDQAAVTFNGGCGYWVWLAGCIDCVGGFLDVVSVGFLVKCKLADLKSSKALYTLDDSR